MQDLERLVSPTWQACNEYHTPRLKNRLAGGFFILMLIPTHNRGKIYGLSGVYRHMLPDLPKLTFLSIQSLVIHEEHDPQRTPPLIERIRLSGTFRNPPIVTPLPDNTARFMVLDGANRVTALKEMGFPDILVQLVEPNDPGLNLETWNHVVWGLPEQLLLDKFTHLAGVEVCPASEEYLEPELDGDCGLAFIQLPRGDNYRICSKAVELVKRVEILNDLVNCYKVRAYLDRTNIRDIHQLQDIYSDLTCLIIFPTFTIHQILDLASNNYLLPTGVTRFTVAPRALHLNYPLYELATNRPLEEKNADLLRWIQRRIANKGIRYYAESTFLYDE